MSKSVANEIRSRLPNEQFKTWKFAEFLIRVYPRPISRRFGAQLR